MKEAPVPITNDDFGALHSVYVLDTGAQFTKDLPIVDNDDDL